MPNVKTAISLEPELFAQIDELACSMNVSRSRVFVLATEEFLKRRRNAQITQQINEAYTDEAEKEDQELLRHMRSAYRRHTELEW